ncbi:ABC transporter ATP-binding protein [Desmospora profundinema]|uniref:ABC-2 type transport system ATP-binding protein n=1 Tax=Desmospora profundinema TaxID=1571184 RepID=A0ABU1ILF0_9BACL|nr:ABC transporter ATP-binding protein [Desmospora profundinema]MDR6225598.1 ABC-2 type transport system ATP-binding protein [Desmospora profundinema]
MEYVIETNRLTKLYEGNKGCREITLQVPRGVVFGFLGPNGAGKSTFVRTLLGLIHPNSGTASLLGHPVPSIASRKKVGYLPELFRYPDWMTGRQLLDLHADLSEVPRVGRKKKISDLLEKVGLHQRGEDKIRGYSKGMQQRIGIATALISDPEVIFLDEPTSALDPIGRKEVRDMIREWREQGKTVFLNSHLLSEAETVCNHVAIINHGHLVVQGDWRQLSAVEPQVEVTVSDMDDYGWESFSGWGMKWEQIDQGEDRSTWLLTLSEEKQIPALVSALTDRGMKVYQVTPRQQSLEELFMYWVNRKENAAHVDHC